MKKNDPLDLSMNEKGCDLQNPSLIQLVPDRRVWSKVQSFWQKTLKANTNHLLWIYTNHAIDLF